MRKENGNAAEDIDDTPTVFLPSMYSLRFLCYFYREKIGHGEFSSECDISRRSFNRIFHSKELSWLRIRSPRDDVCDVCMLYRRKMADLLQKQGSKAAPEKLGGVGNDFARHRDLAITARNQYRAECKKAKEGAERIQKALENNQSEGILKGLLSEYEAHHSFDFSQSLWPPQMADTPGRFYFLSLRGIDLFGIVDDGGTGTPSQINMLYDSDCRGQRFFGSRFNVISVFDLSPSPPVCITAGVFSCG